MIVVQNPSHSYIDLLSETLHVLDSDSLDVNIIPNIQKSSGFSLDISPTLDTNKMFFDSGAESDDSGNHSFPDISFQNRKCSLFDEGDVYLNYAEDGSVPKDLNLLEYLDCVRTEDENSVNVPKLFEEGSDDEDNSDDDDSSSSSGCSDESSSGSSSSEEEMDEEDEGGKNNKLR